MSQESTAHEHFIDKRKHTEIKHTIFSKVLKVSLSIANGMTKRNKKYDKKYTYIDLYAGRGTFDDGSEGSPLLAFNAIEEQFNLTDNIFQEIMLVATEENPNNVEILKNKLVNLHSKTNLGDKLKILVGENTWESYDKQLRSLLQKSQWCFIFADPFSTELKLGNLKELIKTNSFYKDILLLINLNALERLFGTNNENNLNIIAEYFDVDIKEIIDLKFQQDISNVQKIQYLIHKTFTNLNKDYVINIALPRTKSKNNELENSDRFYLTLITGAVGVADEFLKIYAELLGDKNCNRGQLSLFSSYNDIVYFNLIEKIKDIVNAKKQVSLFDIVIELYGYFYSWKKANEKEIPTKKNIQNAINVLSMQNIIDFKSKAFLYKNEKKITLEALDKKENQKQVIISIAS